MAQQSNWEADKMLDVYIYDYLVKRNLQASAKAFQAEGKVSSDPVAIDAPGGFLFEWWSVFWDIFIARTNEKHSEVAASYIETQQIKAREQQQQHQMHHQQQHHQQLVQQQHQQSHQQNPQQQHQQNHQQIQPSQQQHQQNQQQLQQQQQQIQQNQQQQQQQQHQQQQQQQQQLHLQQIHLLQRQAQQQQQQPRSMNGPGNGLGDPLLTTTANAIATKIYEERLKPPPHQRDTLEDMKRYGEAPRELLDPNQASILKVASATGPSGPLLHGTPNTSVAGLQQRPQLPGSSQDNKNDIAVINQRSPAPDASMFGVPSVKPNLLSPGLNQGNNSLPLKGWPGMEQLRPGLTNQKPGLQSSQGYHVLSPQHQQLMLQAQAQGSLPSSASPLLAEMDPRKIRLLFGGRGGISGKDAQGNPLNDVAQAVSSPLQAASTLLARNNPQDSEMLMKMKMAQMQQSHSQAQNNQQGQPQQQQGQSQPPQATPQQQQQDRIGVVGGVPVDGALSNSFRPTDQVYSTMEPSPSTNSTGTGKVPPSKGMNGRKRKQPASSSGPANSTGTGNTGTGPSPNSPSSPSTHTPGDVISMAGALQQNGGLTKALVLYGSDGTGTLASPSNHLAEIERFEDGSLDDNVESFLSHDDADHRDSLFGNTKRSPAGHNAEVTKGFQFNEVGNLRASTSKVVCCHFSSDGKLLASAGHDKKAVLWNMDTLKLKSTLEEHSFLITDVRFSPNSTRLATSSFDKTVRVWDADNPSYSLRTFTGHQTSVMSLDFHPVSEDLLCSCDGDSEIRYWSVNQGVCSRVFKGGMTQTRFQPRVGRLLAAAAENVVSIFDVETETCVHSLQRHTKPVHSVCWDSTGDYVASVSEDSVRVWDLGSGGREGECIHELSCNGNKFHSCVFHPNFSSLLVIGCYQSLELWDMSANKSMTIPAHEGLIAALAQSPATGMVASASHDKCVKLWK